MKNNIKKNDAYKTIGETAKALGLMNKKTGRLQTHTIRYWETQFKQIKPMIRAENRRYYSTKNFEIIKLIKFLLKDKGLTIKGVKKILNNSNSTSLDVNMNLGINKPHFQSTKTIKDKVKKISKMIRELKGLK